MTLSPVSFVNSTRDAAKRITFLLILIVPVQAGSVWGANIEILYAPDDAPLDRVITLYQQAKRYIYVSVYGLTYPRAVEALVAAKKRGIDVRMLTDQERTQDEKQHIALRTLQLAGIPTTSGNRYNDERMDIITDRKISMKAREQFL